jgi:hypothetical protein
MEVYSMDSSVKRAQKLLAEKGEKAANAVALAKLACYDSMNVVASEYRTLASGLSAGGEEELEGFMDVADKLAYFAPMDVITLKEQVADKLVDMERYIV